MNRWFVLWSQILLFAYLAVAIASGQVTLTQISADTFTVGPGQHATEVEPHVLAHGTTLVAAFQTGRIVPGGSTDIGWAYFSKQWQDLGAWISAGADEGRRNRALRCD